MKKASKTETERRVRWEGKERKSLKVGSQVKLYSTVLLVFLRGAGCGGSEKKKWRRWKTW